MSRGAQAPAHMPPRAPPHTQHRSVLHRLVVLCLFGGTATPTNDNRSPGERRPTSPIEEGQPARQTRSSRGAERHESKEEPHEGAREATYTLNQHGTERTCCWRDGVAPASSHRPRASRGTHRDFEGCHQDEGAHLSPPTTGYTWGDGAINSRSNAVSSNLAGAPSTTTRINHTGAIIDRRRCERKRCLPRRIQTRHRGQGIPCEKHKGRSNPTTLKHREPLGQQPTCETGCQEIAPVRLGPVQHRPQFMSQSLPASGNTRCTNSTAKSSRRRHDLQARTA